MGATITWQAVTHASGYQVHVFLEANCQGEEEYISGALGSGTTSLVLPDCVGSIFSWYVIALGDGVTYGDSLPSTCINVGFGAAAPDCPPGFEPLTTTSTTTGFVPTTTTGTTPSTTTPSTTTPTTTTTTTTPPPKTCNGSATWTIGIGGNKPINACSDCCAQLNAALVGDHVSGINGWTDVSLAACLGVTASPGSTFRYNAPGGHVFTFVMAFFQFNPSFGTEVDNSQYDVMRIA